MAALALAQPLFQIDKAEAAQLAKAMQGVARHYDVRASAQAVDWANLVMALCMVYGVRIAAAKAGKARQAAADPLAAVWTPQLVPGAAGA